MRPLSQIGDHTLTANDAAVGDHLSCACGGWTGTTAVQWLAHVEGPRRQDGTPPVAHKTFLPNPPSVDYRRQIAAYAHAHRPSLLRRIVRRLR